MRGSAVFRTGVAPGGALAGPWVRDPLWTRARAVPSLDLRFADNKSLTDATTGSNPVTFTRASSATFVDSTGVLRTAVTNLLLRSEEFDNASWTKVRASISANTITAPNGTLTADTGIEDASSSTTHNPLIQDATIVSNGTYTASLYVRAKERSRGAIWFSSADSANYVSGEFNLNTGTIATVIAGTGSGASAAISNVGDGWFRVSITGSIGGSLTAGRLVLRMADATGSIVYTGDGTSGIYLWGAQLEQSATVGEYIPTTSTINSAPRFDHNPTTGESLGLLVEEQRTNLQARSEEFDNTGTWSRTGLSTVTANTAVAPDGSTTADALVEDASTGNHRVFTTTSSLAASTSYSLSVYVKASTRTVVRVEARDSVGAFAVQDFNLTTQAITSAGSGTGAISALGNGWFRCTVTGTTSVSGGIGVVLIYSMQVVGNAIYAGTNGTSAILLWGAQLEAGAFPTSYIPTTTATTTRSADVASITGTAFSSWYRQDEGTMFVDGSTAAFTGTTGFVSINNAGNTNRLEIRQGRTNPTVTGASTSVIWTSLSAPTLIANTSYKQAVAFSSASHGNSLAGVLTDTSSTAIPAIAATQLIFGVRDSQAAPIGGSSSTIKRFAFWTQRLANSTLPALTQ